MKYKALCLMLLVMCVVGSVKLNADAKTTTPTAGITKHINNDNGTSICRAGVTSYLGQVQIKAQITADKALVVAKAEEKQRQQALILEQQEQERQRQIEEQIEIQENNERQFVLNQPQNVPNNTAGCRSEAFSYENKQNITRKSSPQYIQLQNPDIITDPNGFVKLGNRFLIAVGTGYANKVGDKLDILYEDGTILECIVGDFKSDRHTDPTHRFHTGGLEDRLVDINTGENFVLGTDVTGRDCVVQTLSFPGDGSVVEFICDWNYKKHIFSPIGQKIISVINVNEVAHD